MKRREFNSILATVTALGTGAASGVASAQGAFAEGRDFVRLQVPAPTVSAPKIDVVEFFWYGCPHCNALEPALEAWKSTLPDTVAFRRVPVTFTALHATHAKLFFALEQMGQLETLHRRVFAALHVQRRRLDSDDAIAEFLGQQGADPAKYKEAVRSFGLNTKMTQAKQLADAYKIDGVPAMGVAGRFFTSPALAGSNERALAITNFLIERVRSGR